MSDAKVDAHVVVVVVVHAPLGSALKSIAEHTYGEHADLTVIDVLPGACADDSTGGLLDRLQTLDQGAGVLLLTDLPGASPANICMRASGFAKAAGTHCQVVSGVNAAMVLRVLNYHTSDLDELSRVAIEGAIQTIKRVD
jgi:PTS system ascorbate-specific IIA component